MKLERVIDLVATKTYNDKELSLDTKAYILRELASAKSMLPSEYIGLESNVKEKRFVKFNTVSNEKITIDINAITGFGIANYYNASSKMRSCLHVNIMGSNWPLIDYHGVDEFINEFFK